MADPRFFHASGPFTVAELASRTGAEIGGAGNADLLLTGVAAIEAAGAQEISFLANARYAAAFAASRAGAAFVHPSFAAKAPPEMTLLISSAPYRAFALAVQAFFPRPRPVPGVAPSAVIEDGVELGSGVSVAAHAVIETGASIGAGSAIGANSVIGRGVVIGADCIVGANVTISHALIGDRVTIYPGARIGQDGFGFAPDVSGHVKIPQLGRVLIGDDVEIGANTTIDRGAGPDTVIGAGCMIDNLVQIAHNVTLGRGTILVAQSGVAGSAKVGNFVSVGGQTAIVGHLTVGDGARIAGKSGVTRDVPAGASMGGIPAVTLVQWHRQTVALERLTKRKDK